MKSTSNTTGIAAKLKYRFAQLLLSSSCTAAAAAVVGESKPPPAATPPPPALDLGCCHRRKLDLTVDRRLLRRVAPLAQATIDCAAAPRSSEISSQPLAAFLKKEEEDTKHERKIHSFPKHSSVTTRRARKKKALFSNAYGFTSSSNSSSSGGEEEKGVDEEPSATLLLSSKTFSSASSEFYRRSMKTKKQKQQRMQSIYYCGDQPRRRPLVPISSKKKPEVGFLAVVKRSNNPYDDFRSSMAEMMVELSISGGRELEQLLHSYLALNSPRHHRVIFAAFADTWQGILLLNQQKKG